VASSPIYLYAHRPRQRKAERVLFAAEADDQRTVERLAANHLEPFAWR